MIHILVWWWTIELFAFYFAKVKADKKSCSISANFFVCKGSHIFALRVVKFWQVFIALDSCTELGFVRQILVHKCARNLGTDPRVPLDWCKKRHRPRNNEFRELAKRGEAPQWNILRQTCVLAGPCMRLTQNPSERFLARHFLRNGIEIRITPGGRNRLTPLPSDGWCRGNKCGRNMENGHRRLVRETPPIWLIQVNHYHSSITSVKITHLGSDWPHTFSWVMVACRVSLPIVSDYTYILLHSSVCRFWFVTDTIMICVQDWRNL